MPISGWLSSYARVNKIGRDPNGAWHPFLDEIEREHDNLRAALDWMVRSRPALDWMLKSGESVGWDFLAAMSTVWERSYQTEGRRWSARLMELSAGSVPGPLWGWMHAMAAQLARQQGDFAAAVPLVQASQAIFQELGHSAGERWCCHLFALLARCQGDYTRARAFYDKLGSMAREAANESVPYRIGYSPRLAAGAALYEAGYVAYLEGDLGTAQTLLQQGLHDFRDPHDQEVGHAATCQAHLAEVFDARGDYAAAQAHLEESLATMPDYPWHAGYVRQKLGRVAGHQSQWSAAAEYFAESLAMWRQIGNQQGITECFEGLGVAAVAQGQPEWGATLLGSAEALRESRNVPIPPVERADVEQAIAAANAQLGEKTFMSAWTAGRSLAVAPLFTEFLD